MTDATRWRIRGATLPVGARPLVMGVVNVTPDSFSDGGRFMDTDDAVEHALRLVEEGADILDVGGESTRPGSDPVQADEEWRRIGVVIHRLADATDVPVSVDTRHAEVARRALEGGAQIVNDVSALADPDMAGVVRDADAGVVLMHIQGDAKTMQDEPHYHDVVAEVARWLAGRASAAEASGINRDAIAVDPGIGFGKRTGHGIEDNLTLLRNTGRFCALGYPVLVGASRKRFIGNVLSVGTDERLEGSLAAAAVAVYEGAHIVRVHDVRPTRRMVDLVAAARREPRHKD